jgi:hypothetical protein
LCWEVWDFLKIKKRKPRVLRGKPLTPKNVRKGNKRRILKGKKPPNRRKIQTRERALSRGKILK